MKKFRHKLNKFYKVYDITFSNTRLTKADMYDHNALMSAYEALWMSMECYEDNSAEYQWMSALYAELGDYISRGTMWYQSQTMGNIVATKREVVAQMFDSWLNYRVVDIKWIKVEV